MKSVATAATDGLGPGSCKTGDRRTASSATVRCAKGRRERAVPSMRLSPERFCDDRGRGAPEKDHGADGRGGSCRGPGRQGPRRADPQRCQAELLENGRLDRTASIAAAAQDRRQHQTHGSARHARRRGIPRRRQRAPERRSDLWSNCRSHRTYRWTHVRIRGSGAEQRAAGADGERAGCARVAEGARFCHARCSAKSHTVPRDRTPRHFAVLRLARLCFPRPASCEICRRHCRRPPQHRSGDIVGEFFHP